MTDDQFLHRFESHALDQFSHRDHIRLAFAYARRGGVAAAVDGARGIRGFAEAHGLPRKYHETVTVAWARVVGRLAVDSAPLPFGEFLHANPQLLRPGVRSRTTATLSSTASGRARPSSSPTWRRCRPNSKGSLLT